MSTDWVAIGAIATFIAVAVALGFGIYNVIKANKFRARDAKVRHLERIVDWATRAKLASSIPISEGESRDITLRYENLFLRLHGAITEGEFILAISKDIGYGDDVEALDKTYGSLWYCIGRQTGRQIDELIDLWGYDSIGMIPFIREKYEGAVDKSKISDECISVLIQEYKDLIDKIAKDLSND